MSRNETPHPTSTAGSVPMRRRMSGYTPLPQRIGAQTPELAEACTATEAAVPHIHNAVAESEQLAPSRRHVAQSAAKELAASEPATGLKRRMGGMAPLVKSTQAAPVESSASAQENGAAAVSKTSPAPASRRRMGVVASAPTMATTTTAPTASRLMGAAVEASAPASQKSTKPAAHNTSRTAARKTRMGGTAPAPVVSTAPLSAATEAPRSESSSASTRTRMGRESNAAPAAQQPATATAAAGTERPAWVRPAIAVAVLVAVALTVVMGARWLRTLLPVQEFILAYDGHSTHPEKTPEGMPWWMGWQHFFNMFLMVLIVRTGLQVRSERKPPSYWTAKKNSFFSPKGNQPRKVSLTQWLHQALDLLWVANGVVFVVLLVATSHWKRIVPTSWDLFPNMISGAIQYASLNWPTENGWVHYNALQMSAYFFTVFIASPLAVISGIRLSTWWPDRFKKLSKAYPVEWARTIHVPVMIYFMVFTLVHVFLVFFTGALRNLNHMYSSRDTTDWWGLAIFLVTLTVIAGGWVLARPLFVAPVASKMGKVSR